MCQLLGMNCNTPTDLLFSFEGFCARGGHTDEHQDGWGIAFFEERGCRLFIDHEASTRSPIANFIKSYPIKSRNVIAHIRKATQGRVALQNCHPFMRELWGQYWLFAHNGDLSGFQPALRGRYNPVGDTDSERAFCYLLEHLLQAFPQRDAQTPPSLDAVHAVLADLSRDIAGHGPFNFLLSNGNALFAHCSTQLYYIVREHPFAAAHLVDCDVSIDFSLHAGPDDRVAVIATAPLTDNEVWTRCASGSLLRFEQGQIVAGHPAPA